MARIHLAAITLVSLYGCVSAQPKLGTVGTLEDADIREASGLATSMRDPSLLWVINDSGSLPMIYGMANDGTRRGEFMLGKTFNLDWEDLASFRIDGENYLMIADIGDNFSFWRRRSLYFIAEPPVVEHADAEPGWRVDYRYPDGARDAESAAVDVDEKQVLLLSKRDIPPRLYSVPLEIDRDADVTATFLGTVTSLKNPSESEIARAPVVNQWHWQPVGMDISADGKAAVILTYDTVYYFERAPGQTWIEALNEVPVGVELQGLSNAEAIAFGADRWTVFVTGENLHSPLIRIDYARKKQ